MTTPVDELHDAAEEYATVRKEVESIGEADLKAVDESYQEVINLLDRYEERATDWDDFEGYVEFQSELVDLIEGFPSDLPTREAFEAVDDRLHQRTLSASDFERARADLQPAAEYAALRDRMREVKEQYRDARYAVQRRRDELDERIDRLKRLERFEETDFDAPTERLRDPIEMYNESVREDFERLVRDESAREVLALIEATNAYPLVEYRQPPADLCEYVETHPTGTESIPTLLEYAEYSRSKLDYYVEDAQALFAAINTNRTYLTSLDSTPLEIEWPPPQAETLRFQVRERIAVVGRFTPDRTVSRLRDLRALSEDQEYERLRESALARAELDEEARRRLRDGAVERDLEQARAEHDRLDDVLSEYPGPEG